MRNNAPVEHCAAEAQPSTQDRVTLPCHFLPAFSPPIYLTLMFQPLLFKKAQISRKQAIQVQAALIHVRVTRLIQLSLI